MSADLSMEGRPIALAVGDTTAQAHVVNARVVNPGGGAAYVPIWPLGTAYSFLAAAAALEVLSDDAADDGSPAGTGAHQVYIAGLDGNYAEVSETVTLNGTGAVATVNQYLRVRKLSVVACGSAGSNVGNLTLRKPTSGEVQAYIAAGDGHSLQAIITAPAGKALLVFDPHLSFPGGSSCRFRVREFGGAWQSRAYYDGFIFTGGPGILAVPRYYPPKADFVVEASAAGVAVALDLLAAFVPVTT